MPTNHLDRREFLKTTSLLGAGAAAPYFFSSTTALADASASKNDRPTLGVIGCGGMGSGNTGVAKSYADVVAVADVDSQRAEGFAKRHSGGRASVYADYRKVLERDDIDLVLIATPDHWHAKPLIEALHAGKDAYCEKPLTLTIDEGKQIRKAQQETGRVVQVGTQQRSQVNLFTKAIAMVAEGRLGKIHRIEATINGAPTSKPLPIVEPPKHLDWDAWLGPAPYTDYRFLAAPEAPEGKRRYRDATNCHYTFRWWYEYSGGKLTDWGAHHVDIAVWALQANGQSTSPVAIDGTAKHPVEFVDGVPQQNDRFNTATSFNLTAEMADGVTLDIVSSSKNGNGVLIEGEKGRIFVNRGKLVGKLVEELKENPLPEGAIENAYGGHRINGQDDRRLHWINFFDCVKSRKEPISDVTSHMQALNICHLGGIVARLGRRVEWDAATEQITGDDVANSMLARPYRAGYEIEA